MIFATPRTVQVNLVTRCPHTSYDLRYWLHNLPKTVRTMASFATLSVELQTDILNRALPAHLRWPFTSAGEPLPRKLIWTCFKEFERRTRNLVLACPSAAGIVVRICAIHCQDRFSSLRCGGFAANGYHKAERSRFRRHDARHKLHIISYRHVATLHRQVLRFISRLRRALSGEHQSISLIRGHTLQSRTLACSVRPSFSQDLLPMRPTTDMYPRARRRPPTPRFRSTNTMEDRALTFQPQNNLDFFPDLERALIAMHIKYFPNGKQDEGIDSQTS
jgi:hypothetical protein